MEVEKTSTQNQQQQLDEPVIKPLVTLQLKTDDGAHYPLQCVVSGKRTQLCEPRYFIVFYSDRMRSLFAEWVSTTNYIEQPPSADESPSEFDGVFPSHLPLMHPSDTLTIHYLKRELFQLMNDDSQATIVRWAEEKLEALEREYELLNHLFRNEAVYTRTQTYISVVLESHLSANVTTQSILKNNLTAVQQLRNATQWRHREWLPHIDRFMQEWRREVLIKVYGEAAASATDVSSSTVPAREEDMLVQ